MASLLSAHAPQRFLSWVSQNRALSAALLLGISLSLVGINWGRVEDWNLDSMAFRGVQPNGLPYGGYLKPSLHIYLNHILVMKPSEAVRSILGLDRSYQYPAQLYGSRFLTLALFCGTIFLIYKVAKEAAGARAAMVLSLLTGTSAGLITFNHFGTADSPLLFWMMASFAMSLQAATTGKTRDAIVAGALAGLATADKYNGLGVAIAIPSILIVLRGWKSLFSKQCWAAAFAVPLGFALGTPGAIFDAKNFSQDFLYNLYTTPVYDGKSSGVGYLDFLTRLPDLIGWPGLILVGMAVAGTLLLLTFGRLSKNEVTLLAGAFAVFLFYYLTIGRFPRMTDRFVLPVVPFLFLLAAPGLERIPWKRIIPFLLLSLILAYNIFCSVAVGLRFLSDPRMDAQMYALTHFPSASVIENSCAPDWKRLPGLKVKDYSLPNAGSRSARFSKLFGQNPVIEKGIERFETSASTTDTFTEAGLEKRRPDFVTFSNQVFQFTEDEEVKSFYKALEDGQLGYVKVFDGTWKPYSPWTYPKEIDFLAERMVILKRASPNS